MSFHLVPHLAMLVSWKRRTTAANNQTVHTFMHRFHTNTNNRPMTGQSSVQLYHTWLNYNFQKHCSDEMAEMEKGVEEKCSIANSRIISTKLKHDH